MVKKAFRCAVEAQEFYLNQKERMLYWHWGFDQGMYTLEFKKGQLASSNVVSVECIAHTPPETTYVPRDAYEEIFDQDFVYDIETDNGTFQCGPGCIILKNTDSIYTKFTVPGQDTLSKTERLKKVFEVSETCAKRITDTFTPPIELEMEKVMYPCILFSKKRYVNLYWECPEKPKGIDAKGIQLVRRDNCPLVKKMSQPILEKIMYDQDIEGAERIARKEIQRLLQGKVDIADLVISKSLRSHYNDVNKNGDPISKPAHWHLAEKMRKRDPMTAPKAGDRVPYVFIENTDKHALQADRIEDPAFARANNIKPDVMYYLERQIQSPMETLFQLLVKDPKGNYFPHTKEGQKAAKREIARRLWANAKIRKQNQLKGQRPLTDFFRTR